MNYLMKVISIACRHLGIHREKIKISHSSTLPEKQFTFWRTLLNHFCQFVCSSRWVCKVKGQGRIICSWVWYFHRYRNQPLLPGGSQRSCSKDKEPDRSELDVDTWMNCLKGGPLTPLLSCPVQIVLSHSWNLKFSPQIVFSFWSCFSVESDRAKWIPFAFSY